MISRSNLVGCRSDLATLCNDLKLKTGVEVGVDRGVFAFEFMERWLGEMLFCVDNWESCPDMPWNRSGDFYLTIHALAKHAKRVRIIKGDSKIIAGYFGTVDSIPKQVDFVYLDANHDFESVSQDIASWWPVVKPGGIFAGDDFDPLHPGVMEAVNNFAEQFGLVIELTTDYNRGPSWYVYKRLPEPETVNADPCSDGM